MIDARNLRYYVLYAGPGGTMDLTGVVMSCSWEEQRDELAARCNLTVADMPTDAGYPSNFIDTGGYIVVMADWGEGPTRVFSGAIFAHDISDSGQATVNMVAYDELFFLQHNEDEFLFEEGQAASDVITQIAASAGIGMGEIQGPSITMQKLAISGKLSDLITDILADAFHRDDGSTEYFARLKDGSMDLIAVGTNSRVWWLQAERNVTSFSDHFDILDLVTQVKVTGNEEMPAANDNTDPRPVLGPILATGDTTYGTFQAIIKGNKNAVDAPDQLEAQAQSIIFAKGTPKHDVSVSSVDAPEVRKGDMIRVDAGTLSGRVLVTSVVHDAISGQMTIQVDARGLIRDRVKHKQKVALTPVPDDPRGVQ